MPGVWEQKGDLGQSHGAQSCGLGRQALGLKLAQQVWSLPGDARGLHGCGILHKP